MNKKRLLFTTKNNRKVEYPKIYYTKNFRKYYVNGTILFNIIDIIKVIYGVDEETAKRKWRNLKKDRELLKKFTFYHVYLPINEETNKKAPFDYANIEIISILIDCILTRTRSLTHDMKIQKTDEFDICSVAGYDRNTLLSRYMDPILGNAKEVIFYHDILNPYLTDKQIECKCQYKVGIYFVDYFLPSLNLAIEYDEDGHRRYNKKNEKERESFIKESLGCQICRIDSRWKIGHIFTVLQEYIH